ncbi:MAG: ParB/RepB/Spo0J family partition protein [Candidatus Nitrosopolaris sp.]
MVESKVYIKEKYVSLIPLVSTADFERLKKSIQDEGGLLMPIILNHDYVVLDGHHRLRACKELGLKASYNIKDFTGKPLEELRYVVSVNLHRRHLDEFQRAEIALKMDRLARKIAEERKKATLFIHDSATEAINSRHHGKTTEEYGSSIRLASPEADRIEDEGEGTFFGKSSEELGKFAGVSHGTIERVRTILKEGSEEQIESLRHKSEQGGGGSGSGSPGIRTVYAQVQSEKLKTKLEATQQQHPTVARHDNLKLFNKDFRTISLSEIPDESVDLVLVLDFPEPRIMEDEGGRLHEQIMESAANWLKDGGLLVMYAEQRYLTRALCWARPPMLRFYHIISLSDPGGFYQTPSSESIFSEEWWPLCVYVKGVRDTPPTAPQVESSDRIGGARKLGPTRKRLYAN